ncbi:FecR family protein [Mucilaginibacter lappiensis]|uniref:Ferric-dicitrate binding protein FerR (Iron transport regulator) n=1 Tax=Mucilaginibacter lappiensis TaxID=354630 RepID=A0A841JI36_9SPHI|nr:FecR family protein [Mucilaginibacter lappiensis]MBB6130823.1 ferric-dicitrate binding protein FerR (iron transport regulator) [Mucilaginibacter lappiensis]
MSDYNNDLIESLAEKLLEGTITEAEEAILEQWYNQRPVRKPEWELRDGSKDLLEARIYQGIKQNITPVKRMFPVWAKLAVAASVLIVSAIVYQIYFSSPKNQGIEQYSIAGVQGRIRKILLPDKSIVWLKGNSRLEYPSRFSDSTRNVVLEGEALFEVAKDHKHPFIIAAGNYLTKVVGTSFNIKEDHLLQSFKLTVLTGKVSISPRKINDRVSTLSHTVIISPGKEFDALNKTTPSVITAAQPTAKATVTQGTEYMMNFENTGFEEVKSRIEHKFDVVISSTNALYRNCELSADVTDQPLDKTLKVICAAIGANYTIINNKVTITGGGCN